MLGVYAHMNAIGMAMGGRKYKFQNPFDNERVQGKPKKSREELLAELDRAKKLFNKK